MMDNDFAWRMILEQIEREIALWGGYSLLQGNQGLKLTQDSALLSDFVRLKPGERGLELGTDQGGLYVLTLLRNQAGELDGVERNPEALAVARRNQVRCGLEGRGRLYEGDLRQFQGRAPYQVCLCNPPYGLPGPKPRNAVQRLARGEEGCGIDQLCQALRRLLADKGRFYFCWPARRWNWAAKALDRAGFSPRLLRPVRYQADKPAQLLLVMARRGLGELEIGPPLVLREPTGEYSTEYRRIYRLDEEREG